MHELSIALSLIDLAGEEAQRRDARVLAIHVRLGPLSGVVGSALQSAYELAREGSPLEEARLVIEETPIRMLCRSCQAERAVQSLQELCCVECGGPPEEFTSGSELEIVALEITP